MAYASPTTINGSAGIGELLTYLNNVTYNWVSNMLLIAIYIIFLFGYVRSKQEEDFIGGIAVAGYVTFVLSLLLWLIGFVSGSTFAICIGVASAGTVALLLDNR